MRCVCLYQASAEDRGNGRLVEQLQGFSDVRQNRNVAKRQLSAGNVNHRSLPDARQNHLLRNRKSRDDSLIQVKPGPAATQRFRCSDQRLEAAEHSHTQRATLLSYRLHHQDHRKFSWSARKNNSSGSWTSKNQRRIFLVVLTAVTQTEVKFVMWMYRSVFITREQLHTESFQSFTIPCFS